MMYTVTSFLYELDRSQWPKIVQRPFSDYVEKTRAFLNSVKNDSNIVRLYVGTEDIKSQLGERKGVEIIVKPLNEWKTHVKYFNKYDTFLKNRKEIPEGPEDSSADYSMMMLSKVEAVMETCNLYPDKLHIWMDAGWRWPIQDLPPPNWKGDQINIGLWGKSRLMGGFYGGTTQAITKLNDKFQEGIDSLLLKREIIQDEKVLKELRLTYSDLFNPTRVPFYPGLQNMAKIILKGDKKYKNLSILSGIVFTLLLLGKGSFNAVIFILFLSALSRLFIV